MSLHIVGAENLAQDQAVEVIVKFGRDKQPPYTPPTPRTIEITENGEHNVKGYDIADVDVPGIVPTGTLDITANANNIDVSQYAAANVNVPSSTPLLSKLHFVNNTSKSAMIYAFEIYDGKICMKVHTVAAGQTEDIDITFNQAGTRAYALMEVYLTSATATDYLLDLPSGAPAGATVQQIGSNTQTGIARLFAKVTGATDSGEAYLMIAENGGK